MKVVLFCGGLGLRMREAGERIPKPMVTVGSRPMLWHVMKYYAHFGHTDFILCLGHKAEVIKNYFLEYDETVSNDFVITGGGRSVELFASDIDEWRITFVDTGLRANVGQRLMRTKRHLVDDDVFLVNYGDTLTDAPLPTMVEALQSSDKVASMLCVRPTSTFHIVSVGEAGLAERVSDVTQSDLWINGGYFVFRNAIFDYIHDGEDLVAEPFSRLIGEQRLMAYQYEGFWATMDTLKDRTMLEAMIENGTAPWRVWDNGSTGHDARGS